MVVALDPTPQEVQFVFMQEYCMGRSQSEATDEKRVKQYIDCMTRHAQKAFL